MTWTARASARTSSSTGRTPNTTRELGFTRGSRGRGGALDLADQRIERGRRVGGVADGASDHEVVGAAAHRIGGGGDALLVAGRGARGPDARHHQQHAGG